MRKFFIPTLLGLSMLAATPARADWDGGQRLNVPHDQWLAPAEIVDKLSAQGYEVDEIKGLALLLASPASSFITGTVIPIDGGATA